MSKCFWLSILIVSILVANAPAQEAIGWRRDGTGVFQTTKPPVKWTSEQNIVWKTAMPAPSKGSPIAVDDLIFAQSYPYSLLCLRRTDGNVLWQRQHAFADALAESAAARLDQKHPTKPLKELFWPSASGKDLSQTTPVSDGKTIYSVFGNGVVSAHKLDGTRKWIKFIEFPTIKYGQATSPVLAGGYLIIHLNDLIALDLGTGREVWRTKLPASHSTPCVTRIGETEVLVHPSASIVQVSDGKILASDLFDACRASPLVHDGVIYVHGETFFFAIDLPKDITGTPKKLWETKATYGGYTIVSPVVYDGRLFGINKNGILEVVDIRSGEIVHRRRTSLGDKAYGGFAKAGELLFAGNERGKQLVLRANETADEVSINELGERVVASPFFSGNQLFLRGEKHLYCIGN